MRHANIYAFERKLDNYLLSYTFTKEISNQQNMHTYIHTYTGSAIIKVVTRPSKTVPESNQSFAVPCLANKPMHSNKTIIKHFIKAVSKF